MTFEKALIQLKAGEKVRRACWGPGFHLIVRDAGGGDCLHIVDPVLGAHPYTMDTRVLFADDWEVYQ